MKKALFLAAMFLASSLSAKADSIIKYGLMIPKGSEGRGATKGLFLAHQEKWFGPFIQQYEFGYWADAAGGGRSSSLLGGASFGVHVNSGYVFSQALVGPALITSPDTVLGGPFQFNNDIALGLKDPDSGNSFGIAYKHVSSAGIYKPNAGRDFLMFRVGISW